MGEILSIICRIFPSQNLRILSSLSKFYLSKSVVIQFIKSLTFALYGIISAGPDHLCHAGI